MPWFSRSARGWEREKLAALDRSLATIEFSPEGTILSANQNFCQAVGYAPAEIIGKHHRIFVEPAYAVSPEYEAFWRKLGSGAFDAGAYRRIRKNGAPIFIQASYNPISDASGRVVSVIKVASDITEARLQAIENETRMAALSKVQGVVEFKPTGEIIDANDSFLATMGYRREDIVGKPHRMFVEPGYASSNEYQEFWRQLGAGERIVGSFRRLGRGGKLVLLHASFNPVRDLSGRVAKIVKFATDITDLAIFGDALARLSDGDIRQRLEAPFVPAFDKLRLDFNAAADNLNGVLGGITESIDAIGLSAEQIAAASRDLSQRTKSEAENLEETAAALEQVTATVKETTENARLANQVVREAKGGAEKSGEIVGRAVDAMGRIEHSSKEIGEIIGVIDEIAFQTSLLALNAGVEAARAGETGRGFAVVAAEVRALAQRSAEAAKQIKGLIAASSADVAAGVKLVRETGAALSGIVAKVIEINALVGDIAVAAEEQNRGLTEVNATVGQMDQSTQRNAAMAQQADAAVNAMKQQIQRLRASVGRFRLAGGERADTRPRRAAQRAS